MTYRETGLNEHLVGVGEVYVSGDEKHVISAIGLGSCVGVIAFDPQTCIGGIAHVQLPFASTKRCSQSHRPFANADKSIPELLDQLKAAGVSLKRLFIMLVGGAQVIGEGDNYFKVGLKNQEACSKILEELGLTVAEHRLGGSSWRSTKLYLGTGQVSIRSKGGVLELVNIPGVTTNFPPISTDKLIITSASDIKAALAHLTEKNKFHRKKSGSSLRDESDIRRVLTHLTQKEIEYVSSKRERTKIGSLEELKQALAHLTKEK